MSLRSSVIRSLLAAAAIAASASVAPAAVPLAAPLAIGTAASPLRVTRDEALRAATVWKSQRRSRIRNGTYPVVPNIVVGIGLALPNPSISPPGANTGCRPSARHPYPEILVNGTFTVMEDDFGGLGPTLANLGYCVFAFNFGGTPGSLIQAIGPIAQSAQTLASFVAAVQAQTGARKVDLVGHSQGGLLAEYYAKVLGGSQNVHDLVALSPTTHGTTLDGISLLAATFPGASGLVGTICAACTDQLPNSAIIEANDAGPIAQPGVNYTVIETLDEFVVTPVGSSFINEPGVKNEYVQSSCPFDAVDHVDLPYDQVVFQLVKNALDPVHSQPPNCLFEFPFPA